MSAIIKALAALVRMAAEDEREHVSEMAQETAQEAKREYDELRAEVARLRAPNDPTLSMACANVGWRRVVVLQNPDDIRHWTSDLGSFWSVYAVDVARGQLRIVKVAPPSTEKP